MKSKFAILIAATAALSALGAANATASVLYSYTGNPFFPTQVEPPYTTNDNVTASIVLSAVLADNVSEERVTPTSFTLSDGHQTITNLNSTSSPGSLFEFSTNATGKITDWIIDTGGPIGEINTVNSSILFQSFDNAQLNSPSAIGQNFNDPGKWAGPNQPIASTPLPAALPLFATGLAMTGLLGWRIKRKAAAALAAA
jgi:hypothetical protein